MAKMMMPNANISEIYEGVLESFGLKPDFKSMEVVRKIRAFREELHTNVCTNSDHIIQQLPELSTLVKNSTREYFSTSYRTESNTLRNPVTMV